MMIIFDFRKTILSHLFMYIFDNELPSDIAWINLNKEASFEAEYQIIKNKRAPPTFFILHFNILILPRGTKLSSHPLLYYEYTPWLVIL